ncbi:MAG: TetR/AcrR family transcriptional regulator [Planctomycetes bacterium]|nr:TetR/AcrR family transcriptional regulator [Planctomycetota bacterium]
MPTKSRTGAARTPPTRELLLDAAERLFGEQGYSATSLRQLTAAAGTNLAAVNYHFGGKQGLCKAVLARRIAPINAERFRRLDRLRRRPGLEAIVRAFLEPPLRATGCAGGVPCTSPAARLCRLFGRISVEQPAFLRDFVAEQFGLIARRFAAEFARLATRPGRGLDRASRWWRMHFVVGAMAHTLQSADSLAALSDGQCNPDDVDQMTEELVAFAVGGLRAAACRRAPPRARGEARR